MGFHQNKENSKVSGKNFRATERAFFPRLGQKAHKFLKKDEWQGVIQKTDRETWHWHAIRDAYSFCSSTPILHWL